MNYSKINVLGAWVTFFIATLVYLFTIEETMSLWDCSEYILSAYKLEVGHPPGAPLFMMLGRLFSFFVDTDQVAFMVNFMSALSSSFTILFMYWTISLLAKKMAFAGERTLSNGQIIAIQGSAFIGSLSYAFTETFWFSAVEGEVYAMASMFTAIIFWAILKWDEETAAIKHGELESNVSPTRWLILIFFLLGLAIGIHLLGILALPALAYVIYFNLWENTNWKGFILAGVIGIFTLGFVQEGLIPGVFSLANEMEIFFRNSLGMPFNMGAAFFILLVAGILIWGLNYTRKKGKSVMNAVFLSIAVLMIGYGSFSMILIRSNADTPMNQNSPKNLVNTYSYLKREQYGSAPLLKGPYWNSQVVDASAGSPRYQRKFAIIKDQEVVASFYSEQKAKEAQKTLQGEIEEQYVQVFDGEGMNPVYADGHTTFFPRMFESREPSKMEGYKSWSGYNANGPLYAEKPATKTTDGQRLATFGENLTYFWNYQVDWMYFRYFMWNFAGRQNDIQGHGDILNGNWKSGISFIDNERLGDQSIAPTFSSENPSNNSFYFLPLILGLIGLFFHFYKAPKDAFVVLLLFLMTGLAIVIYLNQKPLEPRERDYAYAASFYAFAIWIGLGVYALFEAYRSLATNALKQGLLYLGGATAACMVFGWAGFLTALFIAVVGTLLVLLFYFLRKPLKNEVQAASLCVLLALVVPINLGIEGWDDHDRGNRSIGLDMAKNYMNSCADNSIIFTHGDNDTFPLWYLQEVEGIKTSVRVYNLSLGQTDWYTEQMQMKVYESEPLPIKFTKDQYAMFTGNMDNVYFLTSYYDLKDNFKDNKKGLIELFTKKIETSRNIFENNLKAASATLYNAAINTSLAEKNSAAFEKLIAFKENPGYEEFEYFMELTLAVLQNGSSAGMSREQLESIQKNATDFEDSFDFLPIGYAMEFVRNDDNVITRSTRSNKDIQIRVFPSKGFIIPVDRTDNMLKHGIITNKEVKDVKPIRFQINEQAISREQVMMMDILANFEWDRPIYFSNPYPSAVGKALYMSGYVAMEGMVFQLTPIRGKTLDSEKMYKNLMENYLWGNMNGEGVLLDYYTRRTAHTPYKNAFKLLAEDYYKKMLSASGSSIESMLQDTLGDQKPSNEAEIKKYKERGIALCLKAFELMPVDHAIDYGEASSSVEETRPGSALPYTFSYSHGAMHSFVRILYDFGANEEAEKYAAQVARHLESMMNFTLETEPHFAAATKDHFFSSLDAYIEMYASAGDGAFQQRAEAFLNKLQSRFKSMISKMRLADDGASLQGKKFNLIIQEFELRYQDLLSVNE